MVHSPRNHKIMRYAVIALELFVGVMAIYGSVSLLVDATGFGMRESWLRGSPFVNYQIPALALLVGVGGSALCAAGAMVWASKTAGDVLTLTAGAILLAFEVVEIYSIGLRNFQQPLMFVVGVILAAMAVYLWRGDRTGTGNAIGPPRRARGEHSERSETWQTYS